jgi:hypothetical protein
MANHLEAKHPSSYKSKPSASGGNIKMVGSLLHQTDMKKFITGGAYKMSPQRYQFLTKQLAEMCALDFRPISIVNGKGFHAFVNAIDPSYQIPSCTTVCNYLKKSYIDAKAVMIEQISGQEGVALTTDLWTSAANDGYITVTAHYVVNDWTSASQPFSY